MTGRRRNALAASLSLSLLVSCAARATSQRPAAAPEPTAVGSGAGVDPEHLPALEALERAVQDGHEAAARAILQRLYAREPKGRALAIAQSYERILDGRMLARDLRLALVAEEDPTRAGRYRLALLASQPREFELCVRPGAARLCQEFCAVDPDGSERRGASSRALDGLAELRLPPGVEARSELAEVDLELPRGGLAARLELVLELLPGEIVVEGRSLPAQELRVAPLELVRTASFLPEPRVEPAELERYACSGRVRVEALMERAVRIAPERRDEALDLFARRAAELSSVTLEEIAPALRWLSGDRRCGRDAQAWRRWLGARAAGTDRPGSAADAPALPVASGRKDER